ncbi:hypothetical protein A5722_04755 [Mycobacterium vulneris]|nr:hypothetical protein A5722_04755 [Mycolicibacterium vulneris]OCB64373.1 hypothetical protein A5729_21905 [Mycolicibacterium vulneris]
MGLITARKQALADAWKGYGAYFGACTGAPGDTTTPANEAAYTSGARVAATWSSNTDGTVDGTAVILNVPAATYTHGTQCSAASGANQAAWAALSPSIVLNAAGQIVITPKLTVN